MVTSRVGPRPRAAGERHKPPKNGAPTVAQPIKEASKALVINVREEDKKSIDTAIAKRRYKAMGMKGKDGNHLCMLQQLDAVFGCDN